MFNAATISGEAAQGYSSGQAMAILEQIARRHLPSTIGVEWSGLSYQEKHVSGQTAYILALALLFVFLFLAAQYESWSIPIAVILSLPIAGVGAYLGNWICGLENNIYFHVDAAFGGFSIPFLKKIGYEFPPFDFSLPGVCSITVDPHKMGLAPIPAGGILFRKKEYLEVMAVDSPYLTVKTQSTIVGTRSGAASAATYAIMKYLGNEGYEKLAGNLMDNTHYFKEGLEKIGYDVVVEPELNIVAFNHPNMEAHDLADKLENLGWRVSVAKCPVAIRVVLMNHITKQHLTDLLNDLAEIY